MFKVNAMLARVIPFKILKTFGATVVLDQPSGLHVPTSGKGSPVLIAWRVNWMSDLLTRIMPCSPGLFIDAGANVGQTLLAYKAAGGESYLGIEPNPICSGFVDELISMNQLSDFKVISLALSDENGLSHLYTSYATDTGATMVTNLRSIEGRHEQVIPTYSLDNLVSSLEIDSIGVVKVDVESYELEVLRGMRKILTDNKPVIVCEILGTAKGRPLDIKRDRNNEIYSILVEAGYQIYSLKKSQDNTKVTGLEKIDAFPEVHWTVDTKEDFDYVFIPEQKNDSVIACMS